MLKYSFVKQVSFFWTLILVLGASLAVQAAPVTFRFEATVHTVTSTGQLNSGIDVTVNDVISGQFSFQPNRGNGVSPLVVGQPFPFLLNINENTVGLESYQISSYNDAARDVDCSGLFCPTVLDTISLDGVGLSGVQGTVLPNIDPQASTLKLDLAANVDPNFGGIQVLDTAMIPAIAQTWNDFTLLRSFQVSLRNGQGSSLSILADVGVFMVVPEPASAYLLLLAAMFGCHSAARQKRQPSTFSIRPLT